MNGLSGSMTTCGAGLFGMSIISSDLIPENQPRVQLSNKVNVSQEFRVKCNAQYLDWFGVESFAHIIGEEIAMNPKHVAALKLISYTH